MPSTPTQDAVQAILHARKITQADVQTLRRSLYGDGVIGDGEADQLFALNAAVQEADLAWDILFVEALTDYCVHQVEPCGYVSEDNAQWLMSRVTRDGKVEAARELELLISILQKSTASPTSLSAFVLKAVRDCVLSGSGPLRGRTPDFRPKVCAQDVDAIRRAIFAFGAGGNVSVTREEAELLCDINDATAQAANDPAWPSLFAKAMANHLSMAATPVPASRSTATAREKWLDDQDVRVGGFFGKMATSLKDVFKSGGEDPWIVRERDRAAAAVEAAPVTQDEASWLADRFNRDGALSPAEEALVRFLRADGTAVHASLQPLFARVA
jgi:hypothetical protein